MIHGEAIKIYLFIQTAIQMFGIVNHFLSPSLIKVAFIWSKIQ